MSSVANSLASGSQPGTRSGFIALAGRPNVGKSTLTNALVGSKVAIVSDKPQTTRRAIRAVAGGADWQLVLVDLPGVQRPRDALTERMQRRVESELDEADGCLMVVNAEQGIGPGDRFIASLLRGAKAPVVIAVNKVDRTDRAKTVEALQAVADLEISDAIFPISARRGTGVEELLDHLVSLLPSSPFYFDPSQLSDQTESVVLAELVREQILSRTREEVPHAVEVEIENVERARRQVPRRRGDPGGDRFAEGDPDRLWWSYDQGDRYGSATRHRTGAGRSCAPCIAGARPPSLACRRPPPRPARYRVAKSAATVCSRGWIPPSSNSTQTAWSRASSRTGRAVRC